MPEESDGQANHPAEQRPTTPSVPLDDTSTEQVEKVVSETVEQMIMLHQRHIGPLPSPDTLRAYEEVLPGTGEAIVVAFKSETPHRHQIELKSIESQVQRDREEERYSRRGQTMGFAIAALSILGGIAIVLVHPGTAGVLGAAGVTGIPLVSIVTAFIYGRRKTTAQGTDGQTPHDSSIEN